MEKPVRIPGDDLRPVHLEQIGEQGRVGFEQARVHGAELLPEGLLLGAGQTRGKGLDVLLHDLLLQRAGGPALAEEHGMELVELEYLGKIVELARKGHQGEARQVFVFKHVVVEGGQKLAALHQRIVLEFLIGAHEAVTDVDGVEKALERAKVAQGDGIGKGGGVKPGVAVLAENILPANHDAVSVVSWYSSILPDF